MVGRRFSQIILCALFLHSSCDATKPLRGRQLSPGSTLGAGQCRETVDRKSGSLSYRENDCATYTWSFNLTTASSLLLKISAKTQDPIEIRTKSSLRDDFTLLASLQRMRNHKIRIRPPTLLVELNVPASHTSFRARFKFRGLRRQPQRPNRPTPPPGSRLRPTNTCRLENPSVRMSCTTTNCRFTCKSPDFIPKAMNIQTVTCRTSNWRDSVENLCRPRSLLAMLCFGDDQSRCGYSIEEILSFFEDEENQAGNEELPTESPSSDGLLKVQETPKTRFGKRACSRRDNGSFRYKCNNFPRPYNKKCVYWRYYSGLCSNNSAFS